MPVDIGSTSEGEQHRRSTGLSLPIERKTYTDWQEPAADIDSAKKRGGRGPHGYHGSANIGLLQIISVVLTLAPAVYLRRRKGEVAKTGGVKGFSTSVDRLFQVAVASSPSFAWPTLANGTVLDLSEADVCDGSEQHTQGYWSYADKLGPGDYHNATKYLKYIAEEVLVAFPLGCLDCAPDGKTLRYVRNSGCNRLSNYDLVKMLLENTDKIVFLGDSMLDQLYKGVRWASKQIGMQPKMEQVLQSHLWLCVPETHELMHTAWVTTNMYRKESLGPARRDILIMGFGNWYNFVHPNCPCKPERSFDYCTRSSKEAPWRDREVWEPWRRCLIAPLVGKKYGWGRCANIRKNICAEYKRRYQLNNCVYRYDLMRIARYIGRNRNHLPPFIFWLEASPTHVGKEKKAALDWRNEFSEKIFKKFAPDVIFIKQYEILKERNDSHCIVPRQGERGPPVYDSVHFCYHSGTFEEYLGNTLSAVAAHSLPTLHRWYELGMPGNPGSRKIPGINSY